jgi:hypothetical protein
MNQVDQGLYGAANAYCLVLIIIVGGVMGLMSLGLKTMGININVSIKPNTPYHHIHSILYSCA